MSLQLSKRNTSFASRISQDRKEISIIDLKSKKQLHKLSVPKSDKETVYNDATFTFKNSFLVASTNSGCFHIFTLKTGKVQIQKVHDGNVFCIASSKTKDVIYSTGEDGLIKSYELNSKTSETLINFKDTNKKSNVSKITSVVGKNSFAHLIDVNEQNTLLALSVRNKIFCVFI